MVYAGTRAVPFSDCALVGAVRGSDACACGCVCVCACVACFYLLPCKTKGFATICLVRYCVC